MDGKQIAQEIRNELKKEVLALKSQGVHPGLAVILVGDHPASESYIRGKIRASQEVGITSRLIRFSQDTEEEVLLKKIIQLNIDPEIHGILVQLPLPKQISPLRVIETISPTKDVDGFHPYHLGNMLLGERGFLPCTPYGIMELLKRYDVSLEGKHAVVVGRSNIVGKPIAVLLQQAHATVTMCHSRTENLPFYTSQADILIAAVGQAALITAQHVKKGAVVIDVGINRTDAGKLVGDVVFAEVAPKTRLITPVPGGVGPMTIAMLLKNTVQAARGV